MNRIFVITLSDYCKETGQIYERLKEEYDSCFQYTDRVLFIADKRPILTDDIVKTIGLRDNDRAERGLSGAVFKLNKAYSGFTAKRFWEWIDSVTDE